MSQVSPTSGLRPTDLQMKKLIYQGYILTNSDGLTDSWTLTIGDQRRVGSLFELRRQINFHQELGVLPPPKAAYQEERAPQATHSRNPVPNKRR
ncbi:hypothetical protein TUM3794_09210 [Shewanella colwelliana]|uniref:DUF3319 domain-containing protein n=2 Tax=Shewanella colwelliana TaxID=23 RepID=A0ABQ4NWB8_SHECO|nr:hypothetical protein TUM3794_09210 [Shewanella colwelliana]